MFPSLASAGRIGQGYLSEIAQLSYSCRMGEMNTGSPSSMDSTGKAGTQIAIEQHMS
jgi:hypothetical protein